MLEFSSLSEEEIQLDEEILSLLRDEMNSMDYKICDGAFMGRNEITTYGKDH